MECYRTVRLIVRSLLLFHFFCNPGRIPDKSLFLLISQLDFSDTPVQKGDADIEVLSHSISDMRSEELWRFY